MLPKTLQNTLDQVVAGLNKAGFSRRDYREIDLADLPPESAKDSTGSGQQSELPTSANPPPAEATTADDGEVDASRLNPQWEAAALQDAENAGSDAMPDSASVENIEAQAAQAAGDSCLEELKADMNEHKMKPMFEASAQAIQLPQFFIKVPSAGGFFESGDEWQKIENENLLSDFLLANLDATVNFSAIDADVYLVDAEDIGHDESTPSFKVAKKAEKDRLKEIIRSQTPSGQINSIVGRLFNLIGKNAFYPIEDNDIKKYLRRIVEAMSAEQHADCLEHDYAYVKAIKEKIRSLASEFAAKEFNNWLTTQKVKLKPAFTLPASIAPANNALAISKSLYVGERGMNGLEASVISKMAELDNVVWWHCNLEKNKGFRINGFINHYPDFILLTASNNIVFIETKGDDRDNSDSKDKLTLGKIWEAQANQITHETGYRYHYMMVFANNPIEGALVVGDALTLVGNL